MSERAQASGVLTCSSEIASLQRGSSLAMSSEREAPGVLSSTKTPKMRSNLEHSLRKVQSQISSIGSCRLA